MHLANQLVTTIVLAIMIWSLVFYVLRRITEYGLPKGQKTPFPSACIFLIVYSLPPALLLLLINRPYNLPLIIQLGNSITFFGFWLLITYCGIIPMNEKPHILLLPKKRLNTGWLIRSGNITFLDNSPLPISRLLAFLGLYHFSSGFFGPRTITRKWAGRELSVDLVIKADPGETLDDFTEAVKTIPGELDQYLYELLWRFIKENQPHRENVVTACIEIEGFRPEFAEGRKIRISLQNARLCTSNRCIPDIEIKIDHPLIADAT